jgi:hypothetical protein
MAKDIEQDVEGDELVDAELDGEAELEDLSEDEILDDDALNDDDLADDDDDLVDGPLTDDVDVEEEEEEPDDDDVEASLDVILKERLVVEDEEQEDDDEPADAEDRGDGNLRVLPKQPGEFVCRSCFLVKSETQLADKRRLLCRDCV